MSRVRTIVSAPRVVARKSAKLYRTNCFRRALRKFRADPYECAQPGHPVLRNLIYGWGNEAWSAQDEFLAECIQHTLVVHGAVLECGSGLSTILLGFVAQDRGIKVYSLEHVEGWRTTVQGFLNRYRLSSVTLYNSPLEDYGEYEWYSPAWDHLPSDISLVVCDGPPGKTKGGRVGMAPLLRDRLSRRAVIVLDDVERQAERDVATYWASMLNADLEILGQEKPYAKLVLNNS